MLRRVTATCKVFAVTQLQLGAALGRGGAVSGAFAVVVGGSPIQRREVSTDSSGDRGGRARAATADGDVSPRSGGGTTVFASAMRAWHSVRDTARAAVGAGPTVEVSNAASMPPPSAATVRARAHKQRQEAAMEYAKSRHSTSTTAAAAATADGRAGDLPRGGKPASAAAAGDHSVDNDNAAHRGAQTAAPNNGNAPASTDVASKVKDTSYDAKMKKEAGTAQYAGGCVTRVGGPTASEGGTYAGGYGGGRSDVVVGGGWRY